MSNQEIVVPILYKDIVSYIRENNLTKKTTCGRYSMYSNQSPVNSPTDGMKRGLVVDDNNVKVSQAPDAPYQICSDDPDIGIKLSSFRARIIGMESYVGTSAILIIKLPDGTFSISTNQCIDAYQSRFNSPFSTASSLGNLWEILMKKANVYDKYVKYMDQCEPGHVDVWMIGDMAMIGYDYISLSMTIRSNGDVISPDFTSNVEIDRSGGTNIPFGSFYSGEYFQDVYDGWCDRLVYEFNNSPMPRSRVIYGTGIANDGEKLNVSNMITIKLINGTYKTFNGAMGNDPNPMRRICNLMKLCSLTEEAISSIYNEQDNINRATNSYIIRKEDDMTSQMAESYLAMLLKFNPSITICTFFLYERFVDHIVHTFEAFKSIRRKVFTGKNSWDVIKTELWHIFHNNVYTRDDIKKHIFDILTINTISLELMSEVKRLNFDYKVDTSSTDSVKEIMFKVPRTVDIIFASLRNTPLLDNPSKFYSINIDQSRLTQGHGALLRYLEYCLQHVAQPIPDESDLDCYDCDNITVE